MLEICMSLPLGVSVTLAPADKVTLSVNPLRLLTTWPEAILLLVTLPACKLPEATEPAAN